MEITKADYTLGLRKRQITLYERLSSESPKMMFFAPVGGESPVSRKINPAMLPTRTGCGFKMFVGIRYLEYFPQPTKLLKKTKNNEGCFLQMMYQVRR